MSDIARRFFDEGWIDAPVRPGKAPGAFAHPTTPSAHPYVLVNYLGKPRDVMTLAHELGHGVHQVLAGAQRRADGADAADARRDRLGVRRDADVPRAARRRPPTRRRASRCSPPRSRTCSTRSCARSRSTSSSASSIRAQERRTDRRGDLRALDERAGGEPRARRSSSGRATRPIGPISATSSIRRSMSTPMRSAIAW